jgi:hypothetical protein
MPNKSKDQLLMDAALKRTNTLHEQGRYQESLDLCLQITREHPQAPQAWYNASVNAVVLRRWQDAVGYAQTALARGGKDIGIFDILAHAHDPLKQWDKVRYYGLMALNTRDRHFNAQPIIPWPEPKPVPPPPSPETRERNIIAFSLFGNHPKYCETAVLNVQAQPDVYPNWVCRFYVDNSVPDHVIARIQKGGGEIVPVTGPAAQWPGPMWRLLALNDPQAHRILFRDADSVISRREAAAVEQWLASGKRFHMMRDHGSHVELILAGMWGVVAGSLPPLEKLMEPFMSRPLEYRHFADQFFLRRYVWPYARASLMQHDSIFGFMDAAPFPDGKRSGDFFVGGGEIMASASTKTHLPDGSAIVWKLYRIEKLDNGQTREELVCTYPGAVQGGTVKADIPRRYARWLEQGTARIVFA